MDPLYSFHPPPRPPPCPQPWEPLLYSLPTNLFLFGLACFVTLHSFVLKHLFIYLAMPSLRCGMWDLVPWPGIEPRSLAFSAWTLSHWTTRKSLFVFYSPHRVKSGLIGWKEACEEKQGLRSWGASLRQGLERTGVLSVVDVLSMIWVNSMILLSSWHSELLLWVKWNILEDNEGNSSWCLLDPVKEVAGNLSPHLLSSSICLSFFISLLPRPLGHWVPDFHVLQTPAFPSSAGVCGVFPAWALLIQRVRAPQVVVPGMWSCLGHGPSRSDSLTAMLQLLSRIYLQKNPLSHSQGRLNSSQRLQANVKNACSFW